MRSLFFLHFVVHMTTWTLAEVLKPNTFNASIEDFNARKARIASIEIVQMHDQMKETSNSKYCKLFCSPDQMKTNINEMRIYHRIFQDVQEMPRYKECTEIPPGSMRRYNGKRYFLNKLEELFTQHIKSPVAIGLDDAVRAARFRSLYYGSIISELFKQQNRTIIQHKKCEKCDVRHEEDADTTEKSEPEVRENPRRREVEHSEITMLERIIPGVNHEASSINRRLMSCGERLASNRLFHDLREIKMFPGGDGSPANLDRYLGNKKYLEQVEYYFHQMTLLFSVPQYFPIVPGMKSHKRAYGFESSIDRFIEGEETRLGMRHYQRY